MFHTENRAVFRTLVAALDELKEWCCFLEERCAPPVNYVPNLHHGNNRSSASSDAIRAPGVPETATGPCPIAAGSFGLRHFLPLRLARKGRLGDSLEDLVAGGQSASLRRRIAGNFSLASDRAALALMVTASPTIFRMGAP